MNSDHTRWRKSSYSGGQGGNCIEVASHYGAILVRDTKHRSQLQAFSAAGWRAFVASVRAGTFNLNESGRVL
jgi:Domain of unknown function (DUF397)